MPMPELPEPQMEIDEIWERLESDQLIRNIPNATQPARP